MLSTREASSLNVKASAWRDAVSPQTRHRSISATCEACSGTSRICCDESPSAAILCSTRSDLPVRARPISMLVQRPSPFFSLKLSIFYSNFIIVFFFRATQKTPYAYFPIRKTTEDQTIFLRRELRGHRQDRADTYYHRRAQLGQRGLFGFDCVAFFSSADRSACSARVIYPRSSALPHLGASRCCSEKEPMESGGQT